MKKNGITFNLQEQKFHQGAYCFICGKKIEKGEKERISENTPYMHLCLDCAISNKNIPPKKGASAKMNGRIYMWVGKGIRGDHTCDLSGEEIKNGTPCWWSSTKDDPNGKTESYVLSFEFENPNEYEPGEKTELFSFKNDLVQVDDKVYIDEKPIKKEEPVEPWYDENYKPITEVHQEEDVKSFFNQVFGEGYADKVTVIVKNSHEPYIGLIDYVKLIIPKDELKKYFLFWQDKNEMGDSVIKITNRDKIFQQIKFIGPDNALKPIAEVKMYLPDMICERYEKIDGKWLRRD